MTILTRSAHLEDIEELSVLFDGYRQFYGKQSNLSESKQFINERLTKQDSVIYVATTADDKGNLVGFMQLYPVFGSLEAKKGFTLNDLYINPKNRKQGIGEQLIDAAIALGKQHDACWLMLETALDNHQAQKLYEKKGFVKSTQFFTYYKKV
jgi:ribosomal protein S18 acetylase RimI-like enzyme